MKTRITRKLNKELLLKWKEDQLKKCPACFICGKTEGVQVHHVISRHIKKFRYADFNAVTVCKYHHRFAKLEPSAHGNPILFYSILREKNPEQYNKIIEEVTH